MTDDPFERAVAREEQLRTVTLSPAQMQRLVDEGMDVETVYEALGLGLPLSVDDVLDLMAEYAPDVSFFHALTTVDGLDRATAERMLEDGSWEDSSEALGVQLRLGETLQAWGFGKATVDHDARVQGLWFGSVRVLSGVSARVEGVVIGDVIVEDGATVDVVGKVTGRVRHE